jgi:hypothetical protein
MVLPTKFWFIWPSGFRGEDFLEINQSEKRITCGGHVKIFSSETAWPTEPNFGRKYLWKVLYEVFPFHAVRYQTWPPQVILFSDWLISKKSSPLKPLGQMNQNLVGK